MKRTNRRVGSRTGSILGVQIENLESRRHLSAATSDSAPSAAFEFDGAAYFVATDGIHGPEIWKTDGTGAGTNLFLETIPGPGSQLSVGTGFSAIEFNGQMYFTLAGYLWRSDGSQGGTAKVSEQRIGWSRAPVIFSGAMYYVANGAAGEGIYRSNGTEAGTTRISSIIYGNILGVGSAGLLISGRDEGTVVFPSDNSPRAGYNFYFSNGTAAGTVKSNMLGIDYTGYVHAAQLEDKIVVTTNKSASQSNDIGTYVTDGSAGGTFLLTNQGFGPHTIGNEALLYSDTALWKTNGTVGNLVQIAEFDEPININSVLEAGSITYFVDGGLNPYLGRTDGTAEGTFRIALPAGSRWSGFEGTVGNHLLFSLTRNGQVELWKTDGTNESTQLVTVVDSPIGEAGNLDGRLIISIKGLNVGLEPFITDGTAAGTMLIKDINTQALIAAPTPAAGEAHYTDSHGESFYKPFVKLTGQAPAGSTVVLFDDATEIGRGIAALDGVYLITPISALSDRTGIRAVVAAANGDASAPANAPRGLEIRIDGTAPTLMRSFRAQGSTHSLRIEFNEPIDPSTFSLNAILVENLTTHQTVPVANMSLAPQGTDNKIFEVLFSGYPNGTLPDGQYRGSILTMGIADPIGNTMVAGPSFPETWTLRPLSELTLQLDPDDSGTSTRFPSAVGTFRYGATLVGYIDGQQRGPGYSSRGDFVFGPGTALGDGMHVYKITATLDGVTVERTLNVLISGGVPTAITNFASFSNRVLRVMGTEGDDRILIRRNSGNTALIDVVVGDVPVNSYSASQIDLLQITGGGGQDRIEIGSGLFLSSKIYGGAGNDTILGGAGADRVYGGEGHDWIGGSAGNDILYGEAGNDRMFGGDGKDYLDGGAGADVMRGDAGQDRIIAKAGEDDFRGNAGDLITLLF